MQKGRSNLAVFLAATLLLAWPIRAADDEKADKVHLTLEVVADETGDPVADASIYVKFKNKRLLWRDKKVEWTSKSNREGKAEFTALPAGDVLIQIIAEGWKTYGRYHTLTGPKQELQIKLKKPRKWY